MNKNHFAKIVGILTIFIFALTVLLVFVLSVKKELQPQLDAMNKVVEESETQKEEIRIYLPETCYAVVGVPLEIYNSQVTDQCEGISRYNVLWSCDVGENLERKYSLTATDEMMGVHELKVSVYDNALNLIAEKICTLKVVDDKLKAEFVIHEIRNDEEFSVENIQGNAVQIFLEADNIQEGELHAEAIVTMVETIRTAGIELPIYVVNTVYQESPNLEAFQLMMRLEESLKGFEEVHYVPADICVDSEYNYEVAEQIYPNEAGYAQIADVVYATICGTMNWLE